MNYAILFKNILDILGLFPMQSWLFQEISRRLTTSYIIANFQIAGEEHNFSQLRETKSSLTPSYSQHCSFIEVVFQ